MHEALFHGSSAAAYLAQCMFSYIIIIHAQEQAGTAESGLLFMALYLPMLLLGLYAGAVADRYPRKRILIVSQVIIALLVAGVIGLAARGQREHPFWGMLLLCFAYGSAIAFMPGARIAYASDLVPPESLQQATTLLKMFNIAAIAGGPALAGWLKAWMNWPALFCVALALWVTSTLLLFPLRPLRESSPSAKEAPRSWSELFEGIAVVMRTPVLRELCLLAGALFCLVGPYQVLVPSFAQEVLYTNEVQKGFLMGTMGLGMLVGGILSVMLRNVTARGRLLIATPLLSAVFFLALGYQTAFLPAVVLFGLSGVFSGIFYSLVPATLQAITPDQARGRVMSLYYLLLVGSPAAGAAGFGWLTSWLGIGATLRLVAYCALAVSAASLLALNSVSRYTLRPQGASG